MNYIDDLYRLKRNAQKTLDKAIKENNAKNIPYYERSNQALLWAINRLDPRLNNYTRIPANQKHFRNTKTYSITMAPEDHDRLVQLGKELHIEGGFSGVLTYIAQNCTLIHEKPDAER